PFLPELRCRAVPDGPAASRRTHLPAFSVKVSGPLRLAWHPLTVLPSATRDQAKQKADAGGDANGLPGVGMHVFFGALNGSLALIAQRAFLGHQRFLRPREVLIDLAAQFIGLAASRFLGVLEQALGIGDQGAKLLDQRILRRLEVAAVGGFVDQRSAASGVRVGDRRVVVGAEGGFGRHLLLLIESWGQKVPLPQVSSMAMAQGSAWRGGGMIGWKRVAVLMHTSKRKPAEAGFLLTGPQSGIPFLHQRDGVADDQTVLVAIATCAIATESSVTPFDVQVLQRTFLEGVADIGVASPLFAFRYAGTLEVVAAQVTGHEGQAGNADGCEVKVVAGLPGLLVFLSKVTNLYIVDQVGVDVTADIGKAGVAGHLPVAEAETVATERVGDHGTEGLVVDVGGAIVSRALVTQV